MKLHILKYFYCIFCWNFKILVPVHRVSQNLPLFYYTTCIIELLQNCTFNLPHMQIIIAIDRSSLQVYAMMPQLFKTTSDGIHYKRNVLDMFITTAYIPKFTFVVIHHSRMIFKVPDLPNLAQSGSSFITLDGSGCQYIHVSIHQSIWLYAHC